MVRKSLIDYARNPSVLAGIFSAFSLLLLYALPNFRGANIPAFLGIFIISSLGYILAILRLDRDLVSVKLIFGFAIIFRLILLFTSPSLSDDIYRYIWDGHLLNHGVNPYAFPVNAPALDVYDTPLRELVNHNWMASPYLPASQLLFGFVSYLFPQQILAFQIAAVVFDLLTGLLVLEILRIIGLPGRYALVYLWNPLVIFEFSNGAHVDSFMLFLMIAAFWFLTKESKLTKRSSLGSTLALAAAVLTKLIPILLTPIFWWRWNWLKRLLFLATVILAIGLFIPGAGLGIFGPPDGTGVFGALRIYLQQWNFNGGLYHWLEVLIAGYPTPGAVPAEVVGERPILITKTISTILLGIAMILTAWLAWKYEKLDGPLDQTKNLWLIRLAILPLGSFLLFTTTVHPWYVTVVIPFLPFLFPKSDERSRFKAFIWPWVYFSISVVLSYLTYLDPDNLRETTLVRLIEYIPLYGLLIWAFWLMIYSCKESSPTSV